MKLFAVNKVQLYLCVQHTKATMNLLTCVIRLPVFAAMKNLLKENFVLFVG